MNTPVPANVTDALKRIGRDADFRTIVEHLRVKLEDAKTSLVSAPADRLQQLQGQAQGFTEVLELVEPKLARQIKPQPLP